MSILSFPPVADFAARTFSKLANRRTPYRAVLPVRTEEIQVPTRHGEVAATLYHPPSADAPPAVHVNAHGGGYVTGLPAFDDALCRHLATHAGVVVVNTSYALAPRRRFPVPVEQIHDVLKWAAAASDRDWDGSRLTVGGQSAGGALAAGAARLAWETGGPALALQVLHYPPLDLVTRAKDKPSPLGRKAVIQPWMGEIFDTAYIPDRGERGHRLASPAWGPNADGLDGIAPAVVITAELDRLRAEAITYARKLDVAGALVQHHDVTGADHGYDMLGDAPGLAQQTYDLIAGHLRRAVSR
ncbi:alpha/beta hydrolase fold domain-containing protein [Amycolatopsis magusensis]|uniref:alpha/beta hydrolase fold domain-containing protein n=1 Tax=Amycolatopsis magusensis TaxID=882444 RepID=UPI003C2F2FF6